MRCLLRIGKLGNVAGGEKKFRQRYKIIYELPSIVVKNGTHGLLLLTLYTILCQIFV